MLNVSIANGMLYAHCPTDRCQEEMDGQWTALLYGDVMRNIFGVTIIKTLHKTTRISCRCTKTVLNVSLKGRYCVIRE